MKREGQLEGRRRLERRNKGRGREKQDPTRTVQGGKHIRGSEKDVTGERSKGIRESPLASTGRKRDEAHGGGTVKDGPSL